MMKCPSWLVRVCMTGQVFTAGFMRGKHNKISVKNYKYIDLPGNTGQWCLEGHTPWTFLKYELHIPS